MGGRVAKSEIPGAVQAAFFRFNRDLDLASGTVRVEQLQLLLELPSGEVSVLRFISEAGKWMEQMGGAYNSLVVTVPAGG